jgi:hypothetical protein
VAPQPLTLAPTGRWSWNMIGLRRGPQTCKSRVPYTRGPCSYRGRCASRWEARRANHHRSSYPQRWRTEVHCQCTGAGLVAGLGGAGLGAGDGIAAEDIEEALADLAEYSLVRRNPERQEFIVRMIVEAIKCPALGAARPSRDVQRGHGLGRPAQGRQPPTHSGLPQRRGNLDPALRAAQEH